MIRLRIVDSVLGHALRHTAEHLGSARQGTHRRTASVVRPQHISCTRQPIVRVLNHDSANLKLATCSLQAASSASSGWLVGSRSAPVR